MITLFEVSDPSVARGNSITAREILDQGAARIETELQDQPVVRAKLLHTIGQVYWELGIEDQATQKLQEAVKLKQEVYGTDHPEVAQSLRELAHVKGKHFGGIEESRRNEILSLFQQSKAIHEQHYGPRSPEVAQDLLFISRYKLDRVLRDDVPDYENAILTAEEALSIYEEVYGAEDMRIADVLYRLGTLYRDGQEDFERAGALFLKSANIIEQNKGPRRVSCCSHSLVSM